MAEEDLDFYKFAKERDYVIANPWQADYNRNY
jgi:hypothetical protein